ncbi:terminase [Nocardioides kribbensis]|uniref:terminase n=1 Tax=Nocardioides kribbensis TaxID=305517 RepID=UPI001D0D3A22|nr:terminase [Nocardioides kribbensis]
MPDMPWLPNPPDGTEICLGFDGSDVDDWSAIRAETFEGFQFTPRIQGGKPAIWNPASHHDHRIPRSEVHAAVDEIFDRFTVLRFYYDPPLWTSEGEAWQVKYGDKIVLPWETYRTTAMHAALERFVIDLKTGLLTHDGCPDTATHIAAAVKVGRGGRDQYGIAKASRLQKIDAGVTSVVTHEAACDARTAGWGQQTGPTYFRLPR